MVGVSVTINGEARQLEAALKLSELLAQLGIESTKIAVERNLEIVPRSQYARVTLADGDRLEIVQFIGGG
ncbi:MAG: sulfur carrier protein ThiS [Alphaproteobacteria bacterium]|nr:sulfur carrier protein ThiS [Alphaproteobacteria bacterium]MBV9063249.1 sulfur carrier protein ThiS [Alphaproteobacteria bacterium]